MGQAESTFEGRGIGRARLIVATSVMLSFISFWRAAAIVLNDLGSSAYYVGGIAEQAVGRSAPWFILGVMLFSYAVRAVYVESCAMFTRGGVYRVVKEAMGGTLAKLSVSALMFDYILTGPISGVSAGQYIVGLILETLSHYTKIELTKATAQFITDWGSVLIAVGITLYFYRKNIVGIHESSGKALKIMIATTVMALVILIWCGFTLWHEGGPRNDIFREVDLRPKPNYSAIDPGDPQEVDPTGFLSQTALADKLRD